MVDEDTNPQSECLLTDIEIGTDKNNNLYTVMCFMLHKFFRIQMILYENSVYTFQQGEHKKRKTTSSLASLPVHILGYSCGNYLFGFITLTSLNSQE